MFNLAVLIHSGVKEECEKNVLRVVSFSVRGFCEQGQAVGCVMKFQVSFVDRLSNY